MPLGVNYNCNFYFFNGDSFIFLKSVINLSETISVSALKLYYSSDSENASLGEH